MRQQVFIQVVLGEEGLPAQVAAEGVLLPAEAEVGLQVTFGAEALIAEAAAERLLTSVGQHESSRRGDRGTASCQCECFCGPPGRGPRPGSFRRSHRRRGGWVFSSVALDVGCQSSIFNEHLSTELADVWSLPSVDPPVAPEGSRPWEGLPTDAAGIRFDAGVTLHVSLDVLETFSTDVADLPGVSVDLEVVR